MHVTGWDRASSIGMASTSGLTQLLRARWLRWSLWLLLISLPLLLSASQPLTPEDLKLVQRAQETYGVRAGKRVATAHAGNAKSRCRPDRPSETGEG